MVSTTSSGAEDAGVQAVADRVAAERGADRALLQVGDAGGQGAGAQHGREVLRRLLGEAALDLAAVGDARVDHRRRDDAAVEHDGEAASRRSCR